ncbi:MAG: hypothetical protein IJA65_05140 [Acholeplasmatales bacterium]|nr:hypothetical protein [Acholeplasmatales bacterium]
MENMKLLNELYKKVQRKREIYKLSDDYKTKRIKLECECEVLHKTLIKENNDVEKLNKKSISNFFATITGQKKSKLIKEEKEALEALENYEQKLKELEKLYVEIDNIKSEYEALDNIEIEYNKEYYRLRLYYETVKNEEAIAYLKHQKITNDSAYDMQYIKKTIKLIREAQEVLEESNSLLVSALNRAELDLLITAPHYLKYDKIREAQSKLDEFHEHLVIINARRNVEKIKVVNNIVPDKELATLDAFDCDIADIQIYKHIQSAKAKLKIAYNSLEDMITKQNVEYSKEEREYNYSMNILLKMSYYND